MKLTGKCKEEFEKWLPTRYKCKDMLGYFSINIRGYWVSWENLDASMQYGVYVDFFDSVGVHFLTEWTGEDAYAFNWITSTLTPNTFGGVSGFDTRQEARTAAIEKANEIYNNNN